ncbi:MAG: TIM barrel protein [Candidatus Margulisiibacteriota bacterium]
MFNFGLKIWSKNEDQYNSAAQLYKEGVYGYIELYSVPGTFKDHSDIWKKLKEEQGVPFVIHAPHYLGGMNLAKKEMRENNKILAQEAVSFADKLEAGIIIFHPGVDGDDNESAAQIKALSDKRIVVENKPRLALDSDLICNGNSPEAIEQIMKKSGAGFCLDIGHAICSANSGNIDYKIYLKQFIKLNPRLYHFSDGDVFGQRDQHKNFGNGNYPVKEILALIPQGSMITVETKKNSKNDLDDFIADISFLKRKM